MITTPFENIDEAIDVAFKNEDERIILESAKSSFQNIATQYLVVFAFFVEKFHSPDYPNYADSDHWPATLNIDKELSAVWDFDYYQLSLSVENNQIVIIKHHNHGAGFITDDGKKII